MSRSFHRFVLYGIGSFTLLALGFATARRAAAAPFIVRIQAIPTPAASLELDRRTRGGQALRNGAFCTTQTRILLHRDQPIAVSRAFYMRKRVRAAHGAGEVSGRVVPIAQVKDLVPEWRRHRNDPKTYVVEFVSPGTSGAPEVCRL